MSVSKEIIDMALGAWNGRDSSSQSLEKALQDLAKKNRNSQYQRRPLGPNFLWIELWIQEGRVKNNTEQWTWEPFLGIRIGSQLGNIPCSRSWAFVNICLLGFHNSSEPV